MNNSLYTLESTGTDPYHNIATEEQLLLGVPSSADVLYLWQHPRTVVIGRNQCAWRECNIDLLTGDNGHLARRLSGGGAVYHDLGNLNFTFLYPKNKEDIRKQTMVIADAVASFGLAAEISGRNDITINGRKFSGNAYYGQGERAYHHGTIMMQVDFDLLGRYLNVNQDKYRSKGVDSVRARVVNLCELNESITIPLMKQKLIAAFEKNFGGKSQSVPDAWVPPVEISRASERFSSWDWIYGRPVDCNWAAEKKFAWGVLRIELKILGGVIRRCGIYTDAIQIGLFTALEPKIIGLVFDKNDVIREAKSTLPPGEYQSDVVALFEEAF